VSQRKSDWYKSSKLSGISSSFDTAVDTLTSNIGLKYTVSMPQPNTHYFHVEIGVSGLRGRSGGDSLVFSMPIWTPGSYLVREFSRNVLDFRAFGASGTELRHEKISKNSWRVITDSNDEVTVKYRVYAFEFTVDTSYLDDQFGIINGASVFMFVRGRESDQALLKVVPHPRWKSISCSLDRIDDQDEKESPTFFVPDYDILVDSPIEVGNQALHTFFVDNKEHTVSINSRENFDWTRLVDDIKKIVEATYPVFGEIPYNRYMFLIDISAADAYGGLEHLSSTHCIAPYFRMFPDPEYRQLLSLFSHEFFHAWNVKRMRPKGLGPFDYSSEVYTRSLWISEGITSYYDDLILRRANILTVPEYLDAFVINLDLMSSLPGSRWESAEESSFDTWIRHYRTNENTPNVHSSYYVQGAVIGWMIDTQIARATDNRRSLDDVMRKVYEDTFKTANRGFLDEEFERACNDVAGESLSHDIFERRVRGRQLIDYQWYLSFYGLELKAKSEKDSSKGFLGLKARSESGRSMVSNVLFDSPAERSGICSGDELIAVDGIRIDASKLSFIVANKQRGEKVNLLLSRNGRVHSVEAIIGQRPIFEHRIQKKETATEEEKSLFRHWLVANWDDELRYVDYLQSPIRRQQFDYI